MFILNSFIDMANILYRKLRKETSSNGGQTWNATDIYKVGYVIENPSPCNGVRKCRWVEGGEYDYWCDGFNKYSAEFEECTDNDIVWVRSGNVRKRTDTKGDK